MDTTLVIIFISVVFLLLFLGLTIKGLIKSLQKKFIECDSYKKSSKENHDLYAAESRKVEFVLCRVIGVKFDQYEQDGLHDYYVWLAVKTNHNGVTSVIPTNRNIMRLDSSQLPKDYLGSPKWHYIPSLPDSIVMLGETYTLLDENGPHEDYCKNVLCSLLV